jgi:hypothetical protein
VVKGKRKILLFAAWQTALAVLNFLEMQPDPAQPGISKTTTPPDFLSLVNPTKTKPLD